MVNRRQNTRKKNKLNQNRFLFAPLLSIESILHLRDSKLKFIDNMTTGVRGDKDLNFCRNVLLNLKIDLTLQKLTLGIKYRINFRRSNYSFYSPAH